MMVAGKKLKMNDAAPYVLAQVAGGLVVLSYLRISIKYYIMFNIYNIMPSKQKTKKHNKLKKKRGKKYTRNQKRKKRRSQKGGNWLTKFIFDRGNKEGKKEEKKEEEKTGLQGFDAQLDGMFNMFKQNVKKQWKTK